MDSKTRFLLIMISLLVIAIIVFFLTGLVRVKKGHIVIVSRKGKFLKALGKGTHYYLPLFYQVSNPLPETDKNMRIKLKDGHVLFFDYHINDPKKYYECGLKIKNVAIDICDESLKNNGFDKNLIQMMGNLGVMAKDVKVIER